MPQWRGLLQISAPLSRKMTGHLRAIIAQLPCKMLEYIVCLNTMVHLDGLYINFYRTGSMILGKRQWWSSQIVLQFHRVSQSTVLYSVLFSLYINDISTDIESEIRLFVDGCVCCYNIKEAEDTVKLQNDIDRLGCWVRKWVVRLQPDKCNMMQLTSMDQTIQC